MASRPAVAPSSGTEAVFGSFGGVFGGVGGSVFRGLKFGMIGAGAKLCDLTAGSRLNFGFRSSDANSGVIRLTMLILEAGVPVETRAVAVGLVREGAGAGMDVSNRASTAGLVSRDVSFGGPVMSLVFSWMGTARTVCVERMVPATPANRIRLFIQLPR